MCYNPFFSVQNSVVKVMIPTLFDRARRSRHPDSLRSIGGDVESNKSDEPNDSVHGGEGDIESNVFCKA